MANELAPVSAVPLDIQTQIDVIQTPNGTNSTPFLPFSSTLVESLANKQSTNVDSVQSQNISSTVNGTQSISSSATQSTSTLSPDSIESFPNPLNEYSNYTYHLKFSVGNEQQAHAVTMQQVKGMDKAVIAESGTGSKNSAKYHITKFNFRNTVSPQFKTQNMNVMEFNMTITETFGLTLPDFIMECAKEMGVKNIKRFVYFIELWFVGYDENGKIVDEIDGTYKAWRVTILDMNLQTTQSGTTYEITGIADNEINNVNPYAMSKSSRRLTGLKNLADFRAKLEEVLNTDEQAAETNPSDTLIKYKIKIPQFMEKWVIVPPNSDTQPAFSYGEQKGTIDLQLNRGQDLGNFILQTVLKATNDFYTYLTSDSSKGGLLKFFMLIPTVEFGEFDKKFNDYKRIITFQLHPYYTPKVVIDQKTGYEQQQKPTQINKFQTWRQHRMLMKKYEYIYTGKNTEIIRFDINVANFWAINVPSYLGGHTYGQATQGAIASDNSYMFKQQAPQAKAYYNIAESVSATSITALDLLASLSTGSIVNVDNFTSIFGSLSPSTSAALNQLPILNGATVSNMGNTISNIASGILANLTSAGKQGVNEYLRLPTLSSVPLFSFDGNQKNLTETLAASTINQQSQQTQSSLPILAGPSFAQNKDDYLAISLLPTTNVDESLPISFFYDNTPTAQQLVFGGGEIKNIFDPNNSGGGVLPESQTSISNMIFNIYDKKNFIEISVEIRGDPWWIGQTNIEISEYIKQYIGTTGEIQTSNDQYYANYLQGDNTFLLTFNTGTEYDEDTGLMKVNQGNLTFNGIYCVIEVNNTFENGSFTQTLTAYKDIFSQKIDRDLTPTATR